MFSRKIIKKRKYIYSTNCKKATCKWTHVVQTCVDQINCILNMGYKIFLLKNLYKFNL